MDRSNRGFKCIGVFCILFLYQVRFSFTFEFVIKHMKRPYFILWLFFNPFFRPWLEERELTRQRESKSTVVAAEQLPPVNLNLPETPMNHTVKLVQPGTERFKTGLPEAVLAMEAQLVSLEASIQREQEFSAQQQESLARVSVTYSYGFSCAYPSFSTRVWSGSCRFRDVNISCANLWLDCSVAKVAYITKWSSLYIKWRSGRNFGH